MLAFLCTPCITLAFVHFRCSVVSWRAVILNATFTGHVPLFFAVSVLRKFLQFTKDQNQTNKRKLRVSHPGPPESCFLSHSAMLQSRRNVRDLMYLGFIIVPYPLNAAVLVVLPVCCREPHSPSALSQPQIFGFFLVTRGWIWAGSSVLRPRDAGTDTHLLFFSLDQLY